MTPPRILLDVHAHVIPLGPDDLVGLAGVHWTADGVLGVDGQPMPLRALYDADALIGWMDRHGVAQAWISVPPTLYRPQQEAAPACAWARALNAGLQRFAARHPQRLAPLLHLPLQAPAEAGGLAREACAQGQRRFAMASGLAERGVQLSDPAYEPLWEVLDVARAFVFLHPTRGCDPRLAAWHLHNLVGNAFESSLAASHLALSGVLDRHRAITFCLAHGGGATAAVAGRLAHGQDNGRMGPWGGALGVRQAFARLCVDCITHDADALTLAAKVHGPERILFGSDWPFAMGLGDPHAELQDVDAALRQRIFEDNPRRLLDEA